MPEQRSWCSTCPPANALGVLTLFGLTQRTKCDVVAVSVSVSVVSCVRKYPDTDEKRALAPARLPPPPRAPDLSDGSEAAEPAALAVGTSTGGATICVRSERGGAAVRDLSSRDLSSQWLGRGGGEGSWRRARGRDRTCLRKGSAAVVRTTSRSSCSELLFFCKKPSAW